MSCSQSRLQWSNCSGAAAKSPPPGLEDKIWDAIQQNAAGSAPAEPEHTSRNIPFQPEYRKPVQWKYAALWVGLAGSLAANAWLMSRSSHQSEERAALSTQVEQMQHDQKQLAQLVDDYRHAKSMMADTATQTIVMHTMQKGHPMAATLYWSKNKGEAFVSVDGLPEPPKGMQYQLWAMQGGKPVDMGVLPNNMANTPTVKKIGMQVTSGEAFAISLEKEGGALRLPGQNIYVLGKV